MMDEVQWDPNEEDPISEFLHDRGLWQAVEMFPGWNIIKFPGKMTFEPKEIHNEKIEHEFECIDRKKEESNEHECVIEVW